LNGRNNIGWVEYRGTEATEEGSVLKDSPRRNEGHEGHEQLRINNCPFVVKPAEMAAYGIEL